MRKLLDPREVSLDPSRGYNCLLDASWHWFLTPWTWARRQGIAVYTVRNKIPLTYVHTWTDLGTDYSMLSNADGDQMFSIDPDQGLGILCELRPKSASSLGLEVETETAKVFIQSPEACAEALRVVDFYGFMDGEGKKESLGGCQHVERLREEESAARRNLPSPVRHYGPAVT